MLVLKINLVRGIGHVRHGKMKADDVLKLLEKHEADCSERYVQIQKQLDKLDMRLWGIAVLIIAAAAVPRLM